MDLDSSYIELSEARSRMAKHGSRPANGGAVADAWRDGWLKDCGVQGLFIIGELLDRIEELKAEIQGLHEDAAGADI